MIHPTAIVHPKAKLDRSVSIGPYSVIDEGVEIGADCIIGPHVYLTGLTAIGAGNHFFSGCVIGEAPQDLKYRGEPSWVRIGEHNVFREHVTVHRSSNTEEATVIGSRNFLMAHAHVGHNCQVGNSVILANSVLLGGHVTVGDRAVVSGNCAIHQFVRLGTLSLMQGCSALSQDLPPYSIAHQVNILCGLNIVGLRRAGFSPDERLELKRLYRALFRRGLKLRTALKAAEKEFTSSAAKEMLNFIAASTRGVCADPGRGRVRDKEKQADRDAAGGGMG